VKEKAQQGEGRKKRGGRPAHTPEVVWLREPSDEAIVRAQLRLMGMSDTEIDRSLRERPLKSAEAKQEPGDAAGADGRPHEPS
jgi:hypothetical protein